MIRNVMSEQSGTTPNNTEQPRRIIIGETTYYPKYESSIPRKITDALLNKEQLPKKMPPLGSSIIEDFIIGKIKMGIIDPQEIADAFEKENMPAQVDDFVKDVKARSETLDWNEVFTLTDAKNTQEKVLKEMQELGMTDKQIASVAQLEVDIGEGIGVSSCSNEGVYVSRLQAVRKALDYVAVFENDIPLEQIIKASMTSTIGHELGHKVDDFSELPVNNIPSDKNWENSERNTENKGERFAEYWGRIVVEENPVFERIRQREWLIHLAKVTQLWDTFSTHNASHEQKADLYGIFRKIDEQFGKNTNLKSLLEARRSLYGSNEIESYASPYSRDEITNAVNLNKSQNKEIK